MEFHQAQLFAIRQEQAGADAVTLRLSGEFDLAGCEEFAAAIRGLNSAGLGKVVIDLAEVTFIDSSGIRALLDSKRQSEEMGAKLVVSVPENGQVRRVFELTGVDQVLNGTDPA